MGLLLRNVFKSPRGLLKKCLLSVFLKNTAYFTLWKKIARRICMFYSIKSIIQIFSNLESNSPSREQLIRMFQQASGFFTNTSYNVHDLEAIQKIVDTNQLTVEDVMNSVQAPCDEMLVRCSFEGKIVNCTSLFKSITTQFGNCCIFNRNNQRK